MTQLKWYRDIRQPAGQKRNIREASVMVRVMKELRCRESVLQRDPRGMQRGTTRYDEHLLLSLLKFILNSSEKLF